MSKIIDSIQIQLNSLQIWHVSYVAMILTGLLYPAYAQYTVPKIMIGVFTYWGFMAWAVAMVLCGVGGILKPKYTVYWLSALFPMLFACMIYAFQGFFIHAGIDGLIYTTKPSYTAIIYYASFYLLTLYFNYSVSQDLSRSSLLDRVPLLRVAGLINLLFALVLVIHPNGAGMDLLYAKIDTISDGRIIAIPFYQSLYIISGTALFIFPDVPKLWAQIFTGAMISHGLLFTNHVVFNNQVWSVIPFFIAVSALWWHMGGRGYERA